MRLRNPLIALLGSLLGLAAIGCGHGPSGSPFVEERAAVEMQRLAREHRDNELWLQVEAVKVQNMLQEQQARYRIIQMRRAIQKMGGRPADAPPYGQDRGYFFRN